MGNKEFACEAIDLEILADLLANMHDLETSDLKAYFVESALLNIPSMPRRTAEKIFEAYIATDAAMRYSPSFDHKALVRSSLIVDHSN